MAAPHVVIKVHDVPDAEACVRAMSREAHDLARRCPTLAAFHFCLGNDGTRYEAHVDLRFPQHQVIVNAAAPTTERAMREAIAKAAREVARLEARDPSVAPPQAKAA